MRLAALYTRLSKLCILLRKPVSRHPSLLHCRHSNTSVTQMHDDAVNLKWKYNYYKHPNTCLCYAGGCDREAILKHKRFLKRAGLCCHSQTSSTDENRPQFAQIGRLHYTRVPMLFFKATGRTSQGALILPPVKLSKSGQSVIVHAHVKGCCVWGINFFIPIFFSLRNCIIEFVGT